MSEVDVGRVEEQSLPDYAKSAEVKSNRVLDVFVKAKGKQKIKKKNEVGWIA